jgi:ABC-2 type transport system permease protein
VAGDVFAVEDRLGTWRNLVVAVRSPRLIFAAKALASLTVVLLLVFLLGVSSVLGGLAAVGNHPLIGLDGHTLSVAATARAVVLAWLCVVAPTLAFAAVGLLGSVVLGRSPTGLLVPAMLALGMNLVLLLPVPVALRFALPSNAFLTWRGLFTDPAQTGPLLIGIAVSLAWAVAACVLAYLLFVRRDFTDLSNDGAGRRTLVAAVLPLAALVAVGAVLIGVITPADGTGIGKTKLERSLATAFAHLYVLQTSELQRPAATVAQLDARAQCDKGGDRVADSGPGNDWRCVVSWHLPGASIVGSALYQLDVTAEGRYVADGDGPKEVNGSFRVHTPTGDAPNPLWQLDGYVDLLEHF